MSHDFSKTKYGTLYTFEKLEKEKGKKRTIEESIK